MASRLAAQTSPYLRQHADNPVDWWPWCDEAFEAARRLDRPVLVSIGYSSCHWCHVMAHESFEDPATAGRMNASFINIKVDREERPDVDALYMAALQAMTGRGGWPLNAFVTPDGHPFYAGTYWPPVRRHGLPSWSEVVESVADAWRTRRADVEAHGAGAVAALADQLSVVVRTPTPPGASGAAAPSSAVAMDDALLDHAARALLGGIDPDFGGFGGAPKFPQAAALACLLRHHVRTGDAASLAAVTGAMDAMLAGGLVDQLGGGFHRYCVDRSWTVPHYEKMLYDNAQLLGLLTDLARLPNGNRFAVAAGRTAEFLLSTLRGPYGAFVAALDADTAAGEGMYYTWTPDEFDAVLGEPLGALAAAWFGVTPAGNTEDQRSVLTAHVAIADLAARFELDEAECAARIEAARERLLAARTEREAPGLDTKVITGWNALAIGALARAGAAFGERAWVDAAAQAAHFIAANARLDTVAGPRLAHHWTDGSPGVPAFCDDVATFAYACADLYQATRDPAWAEQARAHAAVLASDFVDPDTGVFFQTAAYHPPLPVRAHDVLDHATPSGNASAALALLHVGALVGDAAFERCAERALAAVAGAVRSAPAAFGDTLVAMDAALAGVRTITLSGGDHEPAGAALSRAARDGFHPATVLRRSVDAESWADGRVADADPAVPSSPAAREAVPRDEVSPPAAAVTPSAEVCVRGACLLPVSTPAALRALLVETDARSR
ncbi:MAG: thioredoxin domain-containing protein [Ardenticatenales bacterium]